MLSQLLAARPGVPGHPACQMGQLQAGLGGAHVMPPRSPCYRRRCRCCHSGGHHALEKLRYGQASQGSQGGTAADEGGLFFLGAASYWQDASQGFLLALLPDEGDYSLKHHSYSLFLNCLPPPESWLKLSKAGHSQEHMARVSKAEEPLTQRSHARVKAGLREASRERGSRSAGRCGDEGGPQTSKRLQLCSGFWVERR